MLTTLDLPVNAPRYITVDDACARLGISENDLLALIHAGQVRVAVMGSTVMVEEASLPLAGAPKNEEPEPEPLARVQETPQAEEAATESEPRTVSEPVEADDLDEIAEITQEDLKNLPSYISAVEASRKYGLAVDELRAMAKNGTIKAAMINGDLVVDEHTLPLTKEDFPEYKENAHLKGVGIGIAEAARKYNVPTSTLHGWYQRGIIRKIGQSGQKILLDEADAAYCASIYHKYGVRGRPLFKKDGTPKAPFTPKAHPE